MSLGLSNQSVHGEWRGSDAGGVVVLTCLGDGSGDSKVLFGGGSFASPCDMVVGWLVGVSFGCLVVFCVWQCRRVFLLLVAQSRDL